MSYSRKRTIATAVLVVAVGLTFWGFQRIQSEGYSGHISGFTKTVFFGSAVVGIVAAVCRVYWRGLESQDYSGQKIALEAMGQLGKEKLEDKQKKQG